MKEFAFAIIILMIVVDQLACQQFTDPPYLRFVVFGELAAYICPAPLLCNSDLTVF
jgi:hypothetical protein